MDNEEIEDKDQLDEQINFEDDHHPMRMNA